MKSISLERLILFAFGGGGKKLMALTGVTTGVCLPSIGWGTMFIIACTEGWKEEKNILTC